MWPKRGWTIAVRPGSEQWVSATDAASLDELVEYACRRCSPS